MFKSVVHKYVKKVAWDYLCLGSEYSQLHAYAHKHGKIAKQDYYHEKTVFFMGLFYDACSNDPDLRAHLNNCMRRYRKMQRAAAKMSLPE